MSDFLRFLEHQWYFAIPLFLLTFVGTGLVIWRLLLNVNCNGFLVRALPTVRTLLAREGVGRALAYCQIWPDYQPGCVFAAVLANHRLGFAAIHRAVDDVIRLEMRPALNLLLPWILGVAKLLAALALLVTTVSVVADLPDSAGTDPVGAVDVLAPRYFGAVVSVSLALALVVAHAAFEAWIAVFEAKMKAAAWDLVGLLSEDRP
jgi:hypothetical protein